MLWGNLDIITVSGCFMISAMCIQFGDCHEILNSGKGKDAVNWKSFYFGAFCGIVPWAIMWWNIIRILLRYSIPFTLIPWWVWAFLVEYWLLFWCFPITLFLQSRQWGRYDNSKYPLIKNGGYIAGERTFIWLSFVSKTIIIW